MMTMKATTMWLAMAALALCVCSALEISLQSSQLTTTGPAGVTLVLSPPQPDVKQLTINAVVDTSGKPLLKDLQVEGDGTTFVATFEKKLPTGLYKLKATVGQTSAVLPLKVTVPVAVASATVNDRALSFGEKARGLEFSSGSGDALNIAVKLENKQDKSAVKAHQAFLHMRHATEDVDAYFVLQADSKKTHSVKLNFAQLSKKFAYTSGQYKMELIFGDVVFEKALVWNLGTVELQLAAAPPPVDAPLYTKPLLHESDTTLKALPEIKHRMRLPDPRPLEVTSMAFTVLVLLPLAGFTLFVPEIKMNMARLFESRVMVVGLGFLASLAAILVLFGWYWVELTMYQTLGYLSIVGSVNLWFGVLTLKRLAQTSGSSKKAKHE